MSGKLFYVLPQISSRVAGSQDREARDSGARDSEARILLVNVYHGLGAIPQGAIKQLRIVGIPAKTHPIMNFPEMGITRDDPGKFVLGTVPVEADGSAYFRVPSGVAFFFQALDQQGMAVQTMRSATYLQPGQTATCIGCHEPRNNAPPNTRPLAASREPSRITPGAEGSWPLDYQQLVQPVLETKCVSCHQPGAEDTSFDLTAASSYDALISYGSPSLKDHVLLRYREGRSTVGACAVRMNPLWKLLAGGHYDVALTDEEQSRLVIWMDTYGQRAGSFDEHQVQQLESLRKKASPLIVQ